MVWTPATDAASGVAGYAFSVDGSPNGTCIESQNLGAVSTVVSAPLTTGSWYFHICTVDVAGNWSPTVASAGPFLIDLIPPQVAQLRSVPHTGDPHLLPGESTDLGLTRLLVGYDEPMVSALDLASYRLFSGGADGVVDSSGCGVPSDDDGVVALGPPELAAGDSATVLSFVSPLALETGVYRLIACSAAPLTDVAGNTLDGNGDGVSGDDYALDFAVTETNVLMNPNFDSSVTGWVAGAVGNLVRTPEDADLESSSGAGTFVNNFATAMSVGPVSYTHLTLPTNREV